MVACLSLLRELDYQFSLFIGSIMLIITRRDPFAVELCRHCFSAKVLLTFIVSELNEGNLKHSFLCSGGVKRENK